MNNKNSFNTTQNKNKKTKWTKYHTILFILIVIWSLGSVFGSIAFVKTAKADQNNYIPYFTSKNQLLYVTTFDSFNDYAIFNSQLCSFSFYAESYLSEDVVGAINVFFSFTFTTSSGSTLPIREVTNFSSSDNATYRIDGSWLSIDNVGSSDISCTIYFGTETARVVYRVDLFLTGNPITRFECFELGTNSATEFNYEHMLYYYNTYGYNDGVKFTFPLNDTSLLYRFVNRTYFFESYTPSPPITDNEAYNQGKIDGWDEGWREGYDEGTRDLQENMDLAREEGRWEGYYEGIEEANVYTFSNLLGSVVDVPLNAITSFFNFELLGYNMANFFWFIMTALIVLGVIRVIFGRG